MSDSTFKVSLTYGRKHVECFEVNWTTFVPISFCVFIPLTINFKSVPWKSNITAKLSDTQELLQAELRRTNAKVLVWEELVGWNSQFQFCQLEEALNICDGRQSGRLAWLLLTRRWFLPPTFDFDVACWGSGREDPFSSMEYGSIWAVPTICFTFTGTCTLLIHFFITKKIQTELCLRYNHGLAAWESFL